MTSLTIDADTFRTRFRPRRNHLDLAAGCNLGEGGCLFASAGKELAHVLRQKPRTVWTVVEGDDNAIVIRSGFLVVNRLGYLVTEHGAEAGVRYTVVRNA